MKFKKTLTKTTFKKIMARTAIAMSFSLVSVSYLVTNPLICKNHPQFFIPTNKKDETSVTPFSNAIENKNPYFFSDTNATYAFSPYLDLNTSDEQIIGMIYFNQGIKERVINNYASKAISASNLVKLNSVKIFQKGNNQSILLDKENDNIHLGWNYFLQQNVNSSDNDGMEHGLPIYVKLANQQAVNSLHFTNERYSLRTNLISFNNEKEFFVENLAQQQSFLGTYNFCKREENIEFKIKKNQENRLEKVLFCDFHQTNGNDVEILPICNLIEKDPLMSTVVKLFNDYGSSENVTSQLSFVHLEKNKQESGFYDLVLDKDVDFGRFEKNQGSNRWNISFVIQSMTDVQIETKSCVPVAELGEKTLEIIYDDFPEEKIELKNIAIDITPNQTIKDIGKAYINSPYFDGIESSLHGYLFMPVDADFGGKKLIKDIDVFTPNIKVNFKKSDSYDHDKYNPKNWSVFDIDLDSPDVLDEPTYFDQKTNGSGRYSLGINTFGAFEESKKNNQESNNDEDQSFYEPSDLISKEKCTIKIVNDNKKVILPEEGSVTSGEKIILKNLDNEPSQKLDKNSPNSYREYFVVGEDGKPLEGWTVVDKLQTITSSLISRSIDDFQEEWKKPLFSHQSSLIGGILDFASYTLEIVFEVVITLLSCLAGPIGLIASALSAASELANEALKSICRTKWANSFENELRNFSVADNNNAVVRAAKGNVSDLDNLRTVRRVAAYSEQRVRFAAQFKEAANAPHLPDNYSFLKRAFKEHTNLSEDSITKILTQHLENFNNPEFIREEEQLMAEIDAMFQRLNITAEEYRNLSQMERLEFDAIYPTFAEEYSTQKAMIATAHENRVGFLHSAYTAEEEAYLMKTLKNSELAKYDCTDVVRAIRTYEGPALENINIASRQTLSRLDDVLFRGCEFKSAQLFELMASNISGQALGHTTMDYIKAKAMTILTWVKSNVCSAIKKIFKFLGPAAIAIGTVFGVCENIKKSRKDCRSFEYYDNDKKNLYPNFNNRNVEIIPPEDFKGEIKIKLAATQNYEKKKMKNIKDEYDTYVNDDLTGYFTFKKDKKFSEKKFSTNVDQKKWFNVGENNAIGKFYINGDQSILSGEKNVVLKLLDENNNRITEKGWSVKLIKESGSTDYFNFSIKIPQETTHPIIKICPFIEDENNDLIPHYKDSIIYNILGAKTKTLNGPAEENTYFEIDQNKNKFIIDKKVDPNVKDYFEDIAIFRSEFNLNLPNSNNNEFSYGIIDAENGTELKNWFITSDPKSQKISIKPPYYFYGEKKVVISLKKNSSNIYFSDSITLYRNTSILDINYVKHNYLSDKPNEYFVRNEWNRVATIKAELYSGDKKIDIFDDLENKTKIIAREKTVDDKNCPGNFNSGIITEFRINKISDDVITIEMFIPDADYGAKLRNGFNFTSLLVDFQIKFDGDWLDIVESKDLAPTYFLIK